MRPASVVDLATDIAVRLPNGDAWPAAAANAAIITIPIASSHPPACRFFASPALS